MNDWEIDNELRRETLTARDRDQWVTVTMTFRVVDLEELQNSLDDTPARQELGDDEYAEVRANPERAAEELITQLALRDIGGWLDLGLER